VIVFDASSIVGAALKSGSTPEAALLHAEAIDVLALSVAVDGEIAQVLSRPKFAGSISESRRNLVLNILRGSAVWFVPLVSVADCRDAKDNKYLELALAAGADTIVSSDEDLTVLHSWRGVRILRPADYLALG